MTTLSFSSPPAVDRVRATNGGRWVLSIFGIGSAAWLLVWAFSSPPEAVGRIAITGGALAAGTWLMHEAVRAFNPWRLTLGASWFLTYLPMLVVPSLLVYEDVPAGAPRDYFLFAVLSALVTVPAGMLLANAFFNFKHAEVDRYFTAPLDERLPDQSVALTMSVVVLLAVITAAVYFGELSAVPLLYLFTDAGDSIVLTTLREQSFKLLDPRWDAPSSTPLFYAFLFLRTLINPYVVGVLFGYLLLRRSPTWAMLFGVGTGAALFYAASSLARAPVAAIVLRLAFLLYLLRAGRLPMILALLCGSLVLLFPVLVTEFAYGANLSFGDGLQRVWVRLTYSSAWGLYKYFEAFPASHDFLGGLTIVKPVAQVLGLPNFYIENFMYLYSFPTSPFTTGHMNAAFQGNLWADFGVPGVIVGGMAAGLMLQGAMIYLARQPKTIFNLALYPFMIYAFYVLNSGSITSVLLVNGVLPVLLLPRALEVVANALSIRKGRQLHRAGGPMPPSSLSSMIEASRPGGPM